MKIPLLMMKPSVKPFSRVRSPTTSFIEKTSPGFSRVPSASSAARPMLVLRYSAYGKVVVNSETFSFTFSARAILVVNAGRSTAPGTRRLRSPSGAATRSRKVSPMSAGSKVSTGLGRDDLRLALDERDVGVDRRAGADGGVPHEPGDHVLVHGRDQGPVGGHQ